MKGFIFNEQTMFMKYCRTFCTYSALLIVMCGIWVDVGTAQSAWMPDANLRARVLATLKSNNIVPNSATTFTQANLADARLTQLILGGRFISNVKGLEHATNLTTLRLNHNQIRDISALSSLTKLTSLDISNNQIRDISALSSLTKLITLDINGNQIRDISALSGLTELDTLLLEENQIHDISPLSGLSRLRVLLLHNSRIYDTKENIAALTSLTALTFISMGQGTEGAIANLNRLSLITAARAGDTSGLRALLFPVPPPAPVDEPVETLRRRIIQDCPVGWVRSDGFAGRNRRVLIYEVHVEMDRHNRVSIYKPIWVAIYVHPDEGLENLDGWKLRVAAPYNLHRDYPLTAENSVVVDAEFVEGGFALIENPQEDPFPMTGVGFTGSPGPGFDYRLYDEMGKKVDFGISCYKRFDVFEVLKEMEDPRVFRNVLLKTLDWDVPYLRSEWTVPTPVPAAPSLVKKDIVGTWADLKKQ